MAIIKVEKRNEALKPRQLRQKKSRSLLCLRRNSDAIGFHPDGPSRRQSAVPYKASGKQGDA